MNMNNKTNVKVRKLPVKDGTSFAQGIEASWESGQWVAIICNKGMVGCGAFDAKLMEEHEQVIATAHGSLEKHLITCEDLLDTKVQEVTKLAKELGVKEGMTGKEAIERLS